MLKPSHDSESTKKNLMIRKTNKNHSPYLKERDANNSGNPIRKKTDSAQKLILEKNPTKNIGLKIYFFLDTNLHFSNQIQ